jgi:hypothetical protein
LSDVRKAFQMIEVKIEDRDYLRFLWWEDSSQGKLKEFRHARVVFGVNCSPFLLAAVIEKHLNSVQGERKVVADKLLEALYVDNCATSVSTYEEYELFKKTATELMAEAKMELRQWECTAGEETGVDSLISSECGLGTGSCCTSVLGLKWDKVKDEMFCIVPKGDVPEKITKRVILSQAQKIFDPIGILSPALLIPKLTIQRMWEKKVGWDEELNKEDSRDFLEWRAEVADLECIRIPRCVNGEPELRKNFQLHTYCDASKYAYAAVVFLRVEEGDEVSVQLLQAKTRVAPLKSTTIPRLELLGCTIAARLTASVKKALGYEDVQTTYWSDSTTALAWIKKNDDWGTFVGNRVREICQLTKAEEWKHVSGVLNPSDLPSRGCTPSQLLQSRWWEGPQWLKETEDTWPSHSPEADPDEVIKEKKKCAISAMMVTGDPHPWYCSRFSSYLKNIRVVAWIQRYVDKIRGKSKMTGELTEQEVQKAERKVFEMVQRETFRCQPNTSTIDGVRVEQDNSIFIVKN